MSETLEPICRDTVPEEFFKRVPPKDLLAIEASMMDLVDIPDAVPAASQDSKASAVPDLSERVMPGSAVSTEAIVIPATSSALPFPVPRTREEALAFLSGRGGRLYCLPWWGWAIVGAIVLALLAFGKAASSTNPTPLEEEMGRKRREEEREGNGQPH